METAMTTNSIPCPFVYANGKSCTGYVTRVEAYKADISWYQRTDGSWKFDWDRPRSHFHLFCSEKGNHAGAYSGDDPRMKFYLDQLPDELGTVIQHELIVPPAAPHR
jgi:hypothetical protein